ncbi:MAG: hypothetical protein QMC85_07555, partial [Methanocellales archaeon]|nr:hypothetical protein [Methanocellales archaeon]
FMADNTNLDKSYLINWHDTDYYRLVKGISGVGTNLIDVAKKRDPIKHRLKATRDASGNFELFFDGKSEGTATDTELKTGNYLAVRGYEIGESTDNIKVY